MNGEEQGEVMSLEELWTQIGMAMRQGWTWLWFYFQTNPVTVLLIIVAAVIAWWLLKPKFS